MKFRKKPVVIEAVQWLASMASWDEIMAMGDVKWKPGDLGGDWFSIETLEGDMRVSKGDWVIKGVKGEFYPCRNDIFEATYDPVDAEVPEGAASQHIKRWMDKGYTDRHVFPGEYTLLTSPENLDKVRVYDGGDVWVSNPVTGAYEKEHQGEGI